MDSELLTATEAAALLQMDRSTVIRWCQEEYVAASRKPGPRGDWLIPRSEIERILGDAR